MKSEPDRARARVFPRPAEISTDRRHTTRRVLRSRKYRVFSSIPRIGAQIRAAVMNRGRDVIAISGEIIERGQEPVGAINRTLGPSRVAAYISGVIAKIGYVHGRAGANTHTQPFPIRQIARILRKMIDPPLSRNTAVILVYLATS